MPNEKYRPFAPTREWKNALCEWDRQHTEAQQREARALAELDALRPTLIARIPNGWWEDSFRLQPSPSEQRGHKCGDKEMLTVVAYDITDHKRLAKVAKVCEDYGVRVQYSIFECRLETDQFDRFWAKLHEIIDTDTDRLISYKVCAACARDIRTAGTMTTHQKVIAYVF